MMNRDFLDLDTAITAALGDLAGLRAVDLGCGAGRAARVLAAMGAEVTGLDPNAEAVAAARARGGARYLVAPAEATGLPTAAFDLAFFAESLHHADDRDAALAEAARIVRPGGRIAVLEPEAGDPIHAAACLVDDEAPVYADAARALAALVAAGRAWRAAPLHYAAKYRAAGPQALLDDMLAVDPCRRLDPADRPAFEAAFHAACRSDAQGRYLPYWQRLDVLTLRGEAPRRD